VNNTNYLLAAVQIDGMSNRIKIQTNFSTLSLQPQEFLSLIIDMGQNRLTLKQKGSCKHYEIKININGVPKEENIVNVADVFDLWPYIMYYN
jgi:hypothetical protein